ncbi:MAG: DegT/DnrJ/EryC1/StrS family aminotransferase [Elusimicrobiota bacterium]
MKRIGVGGLHLGPIEKSYLRRVIESDRLSYGPMTRRFEQVFARAHACRFAVFCNSGTSALHLALAALKERLGWKDGDEVLVPAVTFIATANAVLHNRMRPVFVDVDPRTYNLDARLLERARTRRTRAVIPVHLLGLPCDMGPIMAFAGKRGLRVIEDCCETPFARYKGRVVGSFGDASCFSTYAAHYIVTGVGGLALTSRPGIHLLMRSMLNHGRDTAYLSIDDGCSRRVVARRFRFVRIGYSFRLTELEAAMGLGQMRQWRRIARLRKANAARLTRGLRAVEDRVQLPYIPPDRDHMFMMYPIVLRKGSKRGLIHHLESRGIETRDLFPLVNQPVYRKLCGDIEDRYPVARWLNRGAFYVGCHQGLSLADMDRVAETVRDYFRVCR